MAEMPRSDAVMLCRATEVKEGTVVQVPKPGSDDFLAIYNLKGTFYLSDDMCTHAMASLSMGEIVQGRIRCPLHGGEFDIATGAAVEEPCTDPLTTYEIFEQDGVLYGVLK
jgi:nitrite reductase/ring-hydroxylating ferredoxin subunit